MKNNIFLLFLFISVTLFAQTETPTQIYLVRHAEKITDNPKEKDPQLTAKGIERALALSQVLKNTPLNAIYTTDYNRTRATAMPTAENQKIKMQLYDARNLKEEALTILNNNTGKNVLVVGHSNTLLEMIEEMGGKRPLKDIGDQEYNNLFLLIIASNGDTEVKIIPYGAPNSNTEGPQMMH